MPIAAHLFIFYFAVFACITPPVCTAIYAAAGIAKVDWLKIAGIAIRLALIAYIVPFIFSYNPALLMLGSPLDIAREFVFAVAGAILLGAAMIGYLATNLRLGIRLLLFAGAILLLIPSWQISLVGAGVVAVALILQRFLRAPQPEPKLP